LTLQKLKGYCDQVYETNKLLLQELNYRGSEMEKKSVTIQNLNEDLKMKMNQITDMRIRLTNENRMSRSQNETERLLHHEIKLRMQQQEKVAQLQQEIQTLQQEYRDYKEKMELELEKVQNTDQTVEELRNILKKKEDDLKDRAFEIDQLKVEIIRYQRINDTLSKDNHDLSQKNEMLTESSTVLLQENAQLQKRIRELIDANKDVTSNYQIVKKNFDIKKQEADELALEVDDAKNACQLALKQKKTLQTDLESTRKLKQEYEEKYKIELETNLKKEKTMQELQRRFEDVVQDFEGQLQRKEEQIWSMNTQLKEGTVNVTRNYQSRKATGSIICSPKEERGGRCSIENNCGCRSHNRY
jgi:chromosome segregation ATPase